MNSKIHKNLLIELHNVGSKQSYYHQWKVDKVTDNMDVYNEINYNSLPLEKSDNDQDMLDVIVNVIHKQCNFTEQLTTVCFFSPVKN